MRCCTSEYGALGWGCLCLAQGRVSPAPTIGLCPTLPHLAASCRAVQHMALRKMAAAFQHWRYLAAYRRHARAVLEQSVGRLTQRTLATAWAAWQQHVAETRVARHRVAVCQRRHQASLLRSALAGWREAALLAGAERQIVQLCQRRADRNRMAAALAAFKASAEAAAVKREQDSLAVAWYAERLQAKALRALAAAVEGRRLFESQLLAVVAEQQQQAVTKAFAGWRAVAALSTSEHQLVAAAQRRSARRRLHACFQAWRSHTEAQLQQQAHLQQQLELCVGRLAEMRLAWALDVWRQRTADAVAQRRLVAAGQRWGATGATHAASVCDLHASSAQPPTPACPSAGSSPACG